MIDALIMLIMFTAGVLLGNYGGVKTAQFKADQEKAQLTKQWERAEALAGNCLRKLEKR
jgi:hypothetical protein